MIRYGHAVHAAVLLVAAAAMPATAGDYPIDVTADQLDAPIYCVEDGRAIAEAENLIGDTYGREWQISKSEKYHGESEPPTGDAFAVAKVNRQGGAMLTVDQHAKSKPLGNKDGWLQLRFEEAFGVVPGVILGALCYGLYHVGYGMAWDEVLFLFGLGLVFATVFRLTRNIAVLWPFYTPVGGLYTNISEGLTLPFDATYGFLLTLGLMVAVIVVAGVLHNGAESTMRSA